jgi:protein phosphatase
VDSRSVIPSADVTIRDEVLVVLIGAAGSGKSTLALDCFAREQILSSDECRRVVCGNPNDQTANEPAFALLNQRLDARLAAGLTTVIDATNTDSRIRIDYASRAAAHGLRPVAVVLRTPLDVCLARQLARPGLAPGERWGPARPRRCGP